MLGTTIQPLSSQEEAALTSRRTGSQRLSECAIALDLTSGWIAGAIHYSQRALESTEVPRLKLDV